MAMTMAMFDFTLDCELRQILLRRAGHMSWRGASGSGAETCEPTQLLVGGSLRVEKCPTCSRG
eukprot:1683275-Pyramimonas_sp.AAC.1